MRIRTDSFLQQGGLRRVYLPLSKVPQHHAPTVAQGADMPSQEGRHPSTRLVSY